MKNCGAIFTRIIVFVKELNYKFLGLLMTLCSGKLYAVTDVL
jgi:hypothetical protein